MCQYCALTAGRAASSPNPWRYGGILLEFRWKNEPAKVNVWPGKSVQVHPGDWVVILVTGHPPYQYCDVKPPDDEERPLRAGMAEG